MYALSVGNFYSILSLFQKYGYPMAYQVSFFIMNYIFLAKGSSLLNPSLGECTNTITNISNAPAYSGMESI